jgi:nucleotide-binding universal stress UspA family protein
MYHKLAVPLDGSPLAESTLPYAQQLVTLLGAQLLLIRVAEIPEPMFEDFDREAQVMEDTQGYLEDIKERITASDSRLHLTPDQLETLAIFDQSPQELAEIATAKGVDLLVMTTHGRSGFARLIMGSIASKVLQDAKLPVVLIRPVERGAVESVGGAEPLSLGRRVGPIVVTLDGTIEAETVLESAIELAKQLKTNLHLLQVVKPVELVPVTEIAPLYIYDEADVEQVLGEEREQARQYLEKVQNILTEKGVSSTVEVRVGHAAMQIVDCAQQQEAVLVAMATHARSGLGQIFLSSVAEEVLRQSHRPVLMVHRAAHSRKMQSVARLSKEAR